MIILTQCVRTDWLGWPPH